MKSFISPVKAVMLGGFLAAAVCAGAQEYPQKSNLPTVYIDTENHQNITSKENYVRATLRYVDGGEVTVYDAMGIRGRGNSTWNLDKKPYRIKFDKKQEFLGPDRAKAKSWTLLANYVDKTLMRNALAAYIGDIAGQPFTAAAQFADVVLNGRYIGNYQISDQVEVRGKRVDIVEQEDPVTEDSDITGGYLLEVDGFADYEPVWITTAKGIKITVKSPDDEIIDPRQTEYIRSYIQSFEDALFSADFTNPETGYRKYVDESTLLSWYVASELTANPDAFWSTYIYKNREDPKIYWGPLWDYDIAFNNCQRKGDVTRRLVLDDGFGSDLTGVWVRRMWEDPWFVNAVNDKWQSMVADGIENRLIEYINAQATLLSASKELDSRLWPINRRVYDEYMLFDTYAETVDFLKTFIHGRVAYLTETFAEAAAGAVPTPPFVAEEEYYYRIHNAHTMACADLSDDGQHVCGRTYAEDSESQHWQIKDAGNGYYIIVNRANGKAITDLAEFRDGTYQRSSRLGVTTEDDTDLRQHWKPVPLAKGGSYIMENRLTGLAWNNSGGSSAEGNPFISWDNDSNNPDKPNRHWRLIRDRLIDLSGIETMTASGSRYIVTYSASACVLRFLAEGELTGSYTVCNLAGATAMQGAVAGSINVSALAPGVYVLAWNVDGRTISRKFVKI